MHSRISIPDRYRLADGQIDVAAIKDHVAIEDVVRLATRRMTGGGDSLSALCPMHEDHRPSLSVTPSLGLWYCHACGVGGDVVDFVRHNAQVSFLDACEWLAGCNPTCDPRRRTTSIDAAERRTRHREQARLEWNAAIPIADTVVETYLASRGVGDGVPGSVRFGMTPRWFDFEKGREGPRLPAMISACQEVDGRITGIQRLFLDRHGRKHRGDAPRLCLGQIRGGALRLGPEATELTLCEGVEDGLTLRLMFPGASVWVALGSGNLPHVALPPRCRRVVIAADADAPGAAAAAAATAAYEARGIAAEVIQPKADAKDFNDEWRTLRG